MPTLTCYTCRHDGRCGMTSSPKQCGLHEPQAKALDQGKGEQNEKLDEKNYKDMVDSLADAVIDDLRWRQLLS